MEQIELCLLHVYSDSDFTLQKAKKHMGQHVTGGPAPACGRASPACLPACLPASLPPPLHPMAQLWPATRWAHLGWAHLGRQTWGQEKGQRSGVAAWDALS